jgi:hypothetical protein
MVKKSHQENKMGITFYFDCNVLIVSPPWSLTLSVGTHLRVLDDAANI